MREDPDTPEPIERRSWTPGFWERMEQLAAEMDLEVPQPLPASPYRDAVLDQLAGPDSDEPAPDSLEEVEKRGWPPGFWERFDSLGPLSEDFRRPDPLAPSDFREKVISEFGDE